jgi:hypothetical protein
MNPVYFDICDTGLWVIQNYYNNRTINEQKVANNN